MAITIKFDETGHAIQPTFALATKSGNILGAIPAYNISVSDKFNSNFDLTFAVNKFDNGVQYGLWDKLVDFKLVWCKEWNVWFEISVETSDSGDLTKNVSCISLGEAELSQINVYGLEFNTEDDIDRTDYEPTVLYSENKSTSMLDKLLEKAPHYTIDHVDEHLMSIQRTFSFDGSSIYDCLQTIAEEIDCIFVIDSGRGSDKMFNRTISVYDLETYCIDCGARGHGYEECHKCGSKNVIDGYGEYTSVFVSSENLADNITLSTDTGSVKNCFRLEAGDELMTAAVASCNPNASRYIWYFSDAMKEDMSEELTRKLDLYEQEYEYFQNEYVLPITDEMVTHHNEMIAKYNSVGADLVPINAPVVGYSNIMKLYFDCIDNAIKIQDTMMPSADIEETSAAMQAAKLGTTSVSPVSVLNLESCSEATASNAVLAKVKTIVDGRFRCKVKASEYNKESHDWYGIIEVSNYSDEEDVADSLSFRVRIDGDYENYTKQKIEAVISSNAIEDNPYDIKALFKLDLPSFRGELRKYGISSLSYIEQCCQGCIDVLIENGAGTDAVWKDQNEDLYNDLYVPYTQKLSAITEALAEREADSDIITGSTDELGNSTYYGIQNFIDTALEHIRFTLDMEHFVGDELWMELVSYRREDTYSNSNYISDGLDNAELLKKASEFYDEANKEIVASATRQHSITASMKNLLAMPEFKPIVDKFCVGNWIIVRIDGVNYRLRLISYSLSFDDLNSISVEFSDVKIVPDGVSDTQSVLSSAMSMASTYDYVARQASKGEQANKELTNWTTTGLDLTNTMIKSNAVDQDIKIDNGGLLARRKDSYSGDIYPEQLRIMNSSIIMTDDNWRSAKAAIGYMHYRDPRTNELKTAYGINGEVIIGKLLLGEELGIYNNSGSMKFDQEGLEIANGDNSIKISPNGDTIFRLKTGEDDIFYVDSSGVGYFRGSVNAQSGSFGRLSPFLVGDYGLDGTSSITSTGSYTDAIDTGSLYDGSNYSNIITITTTKGSETDSHANIEMYVKHIALQVSYERKIEQVVQGNVTGDAEEVVNPVESEGSDSSVVTPGSQSGGESVTTEVVTTYVNESISIEVLARVTDSSGNDVGTDVSGRVTATLDAGTGVKTYTYNHTVTTGNVLDFIKGKIADALWNDSAYINIEESARRNYILSNITLVSSVEHQVEYRYRFSSYNVYSHIGTDYFKYSDLLEVRDGNVTAKNVTMNGDARINGNLYIQENGFIIGTMAKNDAWRIFPGGSNNAGYLEIATAYDGTEPIVFRQYTGQFATVKRQLYLLDGNGDTILPGVLKVNQLQVASGSIMAVECHPAVRQKLYMGWNNDFGKERQIIFVANQNGAKYKHNSGIIGGNSNKDVAIAMYDWQNGRYIFHYKDATNEINFAGCEKFWFKDYTNATRRPVASATTDGLRIGHIASYTNSRLCIEGQWGGGTGAAFAKRYVTTASSDIRLKRNIKDSDVDALSLLGKVKIRQFDWFGTNDDAHQSIGFVADELQELDESLAFGGGYDERGTMDTKCVDTFYMLGYIVKAIQQLKKKMEERDS